MSTKTMGIIEIFKAMFNSKPDIEEYDDSAFPKELKDALLEIKKSEMKVEKGFNSSSKATFAGGTSNKKEQSLDDMIKRLETKPKGKTTKESKGIER